MPPTVRGPATPSAPASSTQVMGAAPGAAALRPAPWRAVATVAWLAVLLGFAIEALLMGVAAATGGLAQPRSFVADLVQKVSWSVLVCVGIGLGTAVGKARPAAMGLLGLLAAPAGFTVAKTLQKAVSAALGLVGVAGGPSPWLVAALKALQYGVFGVLFGRLSSRRAGLAAYALTATAIGIVFGGALVALQARGGAEGAPALLARAINEIGFPIGCAIVLYAAENLAPAP